MAKEQLTHFSDGKQAVCGAKGKAVRDQQAFNCEECKTIVAKLAEAEKDPLIKVRVFNRDLAEGVDWNFCYAREPILSKTGKVLKRFPIQKWRLINNAPHLLPLSVVEHLEKTSYPIKKYVEGQESGHSVQVTGKYHRFMVTRLDNLVAVGA